MSLCYVLLLQFAFLPVSHCLTISQPPSVTVHEREPTILRCEFGSSSETEAVFAKFYHLPDDRNAMKNTSDNRIILSHNNTVLTMSIASTLLCDAGVYLCVAERIRETASNGSGTELIVIANPDFYDPPALPSYALQPAVDLIRVILLMALIVLLVILIWKVW